MGGVADYLGTDLGHDGNAADGEAGGDEPDGDVVGLRELLALAEHLGEGLPLDGEGEDGPDALDPLGCGVGGDGLELAVEYAELALNDGKLLHRLARFGEVLGLQNGAGP